MRTREVVLLRQVLAQVVEHRGLGLEEVDQLTVAISDTSGGRAPLIAVVRVVPEDRTARERLATQEWRKIDSVNMTVGQLWQSRRAEERREKVRTGDRLRQYRARLDHPRPPHQERFANAALLHPALA